MYNKDVLHKVFKRNSGLVLADNDNGPDLVFFTPQQTKKLEALIEPYVRAGYITSVDYRKGFESGYILAKDERRKREDVVLCVSIQRRPDDIFPIYRVHGIDSNVTSSINFKDALIDVKNDLAPLLNGRQLPQSHLNLV